MKYETVIGLEVHTQVLTKTKIFCGCRTGFGASPNSQTCAICLGMPGVLPVLNREVVALCVRAGLATHCTLSPFACFARKNYFYPDLPKGYQISMDEHPLAISGHIDILSNGATRRIRIQRIHMEEDAGKNLHEGIVGASHVDLNRAGVPLLEIVSAPDMSSPEEAVAYAKALRAILVHAGISDGDMEKGNLRCDANISLRPAGSDTLGTRAEIKNMNSFRFIQKALTYEIHRQTEVLENGKTVVQETRLWDTKTHTTQSMRSKEAAHDYRYFPEPDLVPLCLDPAWIDEIRATLPEGLDIKQKRFVSQYGLTESDAIYLIQTSAIADFFEQTVARYPHPKKISNWMLRELAYQLNRADDETGAIPMRPTQLADLLIQLDAGRINASGAKAVFARMYETGEEAEAAISALGLSQVGDEALLDQMIVDLFAANPKEIARLRAGETKLIGFFVGQAMKQSGGKADPAKLNALLKKHLASPSTA